MVSVIIPSFNRAHCLPRAIESVLAQRSDVELQVILIDDGSSDGTERLVTEHYPEVTYAKQDNRGVSAARNLGLSLAKGRWIALLDSDDEWLPGKLEAQVKALEQSGLSVCHTNEIWIRNGIRVNQMKKHSKMGGWIYSQCLPLCVISPSSIVLNREVFDEIGEFDEDLPACEDYDLWLRLCSRYEVTYLDKPFVRKFGGHEDQLSRRFWGMDRFRAIALQKMLNQGNLPENLHQQTLDMLLKKLRILLKGAIKHNNEELIHYCEVTLAKYV